MPTVKEEKTYAVAGLRLGSQISTPAGCVRNGEIRDPKVLEHLHDQGYTITECNGVPEFDAEAVTVKERTALKLISMDANAEKARIAKEAADVQFGRVRV